MVYDKAKWHYEADDFSNKLKQKQGGVHIAFFYRWMIENEFVSDELLIDMPQAFKQIKENEYSVLKLLFEYNDGVLMDEDLNEEGIDFANNYYVDKSKFTKKYSSYINDYAELDLKYLKGMEDNVYGVVYSDSNYHKVKMIIDQRYDEYQNMDKRSLFNRLFNK